MTQNSPMKVSPRKQLQRLDEKEYKKANLLNLQASTAPAWANMFHNDDEKDNKKANLPNLQASATPAWTNMFYNDDEKDNKKASLPNLQASATPAWTNMFQQWWRRWWWIWPQAKKRFPLGKRIRSYPK